eukprot:UN32315
MFGQSTLRSALVLNASKDLSRSKEYMRSVLFSLPKSKFEREKSIRQLLQNSMNCYTILQVCKSFLSEITYELAMESLDYIREELIIQPENHIILKEHSETVRRLFLLTGSLYYFFNPPEQKHCHTLIRLHRIYFSLKLRDQHIWREHIQNMIDHTPYFAPDELGEILTLCIKKWKIVNRFSPWSCR